MIESGRQAAIIASFQSRTKPYTAMNVALMAWCLVQIVLYAWQLRSVPCPEVTTLGICYIVNYVLFLLVPLLAILSCHRCNLAGLTMVYCGINMVIKIVCIVVVMTVGWRHVGMCYINNELKVLIICSSVAEMLLLICQMVLMFKRRKIILMKQGLAKNVSSLYPIGKMGS